MQNPGIRSTWWAAVLLPVLFLGCGTVRDAVGRDSVTSVPLRGSPDVPAAQGQVIVRNTDGPARKVSVEVEHLAPPERVAKDATVYVVWMTPQGESRSRNIGALQIDSDFKGALEVETPFNNFEVFVTAEQNPRVTEPSRKPLLTASVEMGGRAVR